MGNENFSIINREKVKELKLLIVVVILDRLINLGSGVGWKVFIRLIFKI